jgi:hypothetical protein
MPARNDNARLTRLLRAAAQNLAGDFAGRLSGSAAMFNARKGFPPIAYTSERLLAAAMAPYS